jgi:hypothetical protein
MPPLPETTPDPADLRRRAAYKRKSALAFGIATICILFILETQSAHRIQPHPASPFIWAALGLVAAGGIGCGLWWRRKAAGRA